VIAELATERSELVVQAAGDGVAERSLRALEVSLCSLPACSLVGAGGSGPQRVAGIGDAVFEAVRLDAIVAARTPTICAVLPDWCKIAPGAIALVCWRGWSRLTRSKS
jgi:hypothetical protein